MEIGAENDASAQKNNQEDQLKSARAEVGEAREENERLKLLLGQLVKDYQSLHMHFLEILQQKVSKKLTDVAPNTNIDDDHDQENEDEEPDLVSLSLGRRSSNKNSKLSSDRDHKDQDNEKLELGLDCRLFGLNYSAETTKKTGSRFDHSLETWPPSKILKRARSDIQDVDEALQKKARVSIRARCDTQTMNDGCQWRKYGQKTAKGNPCPRAYYRCTVSPTCPVRKQVQRCAEDMSILITTYEGNHNHPLPISASAMASTTSAAASMLISRSSSSSQPLHGLSFAAFASHPTCITLDLTAPTTTFSNFSALPSSSSSSSQTFHQTPWRQQLSQERLCSSQNTSLTDTVAKVITSNPTFRSALTAALTSSFLNHHQQGS